MDSGMRVPHTVDRRETAISGALPAGPHAQQSWSRYWDGNAGKAPEQAISEGRFGPVLRRHWEAVFKNSAAFPENGRMLDLACGAGVVGRLARDRVGGGIDIVGVDLSSAAARQAETGLVGNIALLPFGPGCFDRIVSQFGIEYAGLPAFREAARVLTPAGQFSAVVHVKHGAIWRENATCLDIVQRTMDAGILHKCRLRLQTGYKLDRGAAAPAAFDRRTAAFEAAARAVLVALRDAADCAAKAYIGQLLPDLFDIVSRRQNYAPEQLQDWMNGQEHTLEAYAFRMNAMLDASMSVEEVREAAGILSAAGDSKVAIDALSLGNHPDPAAWTVRVCRGRKLRARH